MRFDEINEGDVYQAGPVSVSAEEIVAFAERYDPQWFHTDPARAEGGPYRGLIASGWQTCGLAMRLAVDTVLTGSESVGSPGVDNLRWHAPVRPGDALTLRITVTEKRRSRKRTTRGVLCWHWQLHNQEGTKVLSLDATSLFELSD
ncbi:MAG: MaoC family dehydratase [Pseudomonadota bacterium]